MSAVFIPPFVQNFFSPPVVDIGGCDIAGCFVVSGALPGAPVGGARLRGSSDGGETRDQPVELAGRDAAARQPGGTAIR